MVRKRLNTEHWSALPIEHPDVTGLEVRQGMTKLRIYNIYNDTSHSHAIGQLRTFLQQRTRALQMDDYVTVALH